MATEQPTDTDALMRRTLAAYLPDSEPPIGLRVDDVMRLGRRRYRTRRAIPIAAAAVTVLAIALPWTINSGTPAPEQLPAGTTSASQTTGQTSMSMPGTSPPPSVGGTIAVPPTQSGPPSGGSTSSSSGASVPPPRAQFRTPPGHSWEEAAYTLTKFSVENRLPAGHVTSYFGSRSDQMGSGQRYGYAFHMLWQEGGRYGYLIVLHRTKGDYPASIYGLPVEPCAEPSSRLPEYRCAAITAPTGHAAWSFEIDKGYRMRGIVWNKKDPAGGADIRVTGVFYLPAPGGWTAFPVMDDQPTLSAIPLSVPDIAKLIDLPQ